MSIALLITDRDLTKLQQGIAQRLPNVNVQCWPNISAPEQVEFAVAWRQPENIWQSLPNLKVVSSFGAGCDSIVSDSSLPDKVQVVRIVDPELAQQMAEYVLMAVIMLGRGMQHYARQQQQQHWQPQKRKRGRNVTILGVGNIGNEVAQRLISNGYQVTGWARTAKSERNYPVYCSSTQLVIALAQADFVVNLLPSTPETCQLINAKFLANMPLHSYLINVGRGQTVDESALQQALQQKMIAGAVLDVFQQEPLTPDQPLWQNPDVIITPHIAAITSQQTVITQLCENYRRMTLSMPLLNIVNRTVGY